MVVVRGLTRREFLIGGAALVAWGGTGLFGYATEIEPHWLEIVTRPLVMAALPASLAGARIVQMSDIHVGPVVSDAYVLETFRRVQALEPDVVVYTGDFASSLTEDISHCARVYSHAPRGRLATVGILGNHDYGHEWSDERAAERLIAVLADSGVRVLRNEHIEVAGLQITGFDDLWAERFDAVAALEGIDGNKPMLGLSHNPDSVDLPGWDGFHGLVLSGHTHGGQCRPPFLSPPILPVRNRRYSAGYFELSGNRSMYINRGVGHIVQARFLARPEVTLFVLSA